MTIIGTDDREIVPDEWVDERPFSAVVRVESYFSNGMVTSGSGAMIGPDDVLTAAHCIYNNDYGGWATDIYISPAHTPSGPTFGVGEAENAIVVSGWAEYEDFSYDYGYIDLSENIGFQTGWFDIQSEGTTLDFVESLGYPGDYGSTQMMYTSGTIDYVNDNIFYFFDDLDLWPGQSGSPIFVTDSDWEIDIVGVVSHHLYSPAYNGVLRLTDSMVNQINGWAESSINNPTNQSVDFNEVWYLEQNPNVADAVEAGWYDSGKEHFDTAGWKNCLDPCEGFNTYFYLLSHPDVAAAGINPFDHYLMWGEPAGWEPDFDPEYYLAENSEIAAAGINPTWHYILFGKTEGRQPVAESTGYDESEFLITNINPAADGVVETLGIETLDPLNFI